MSAEPGAGHFPFSDELWWLKAEQRTDDKRMRERLRKEAFGGEGYKDPFGRFGPGTGFKTPPAGYGDYAFILHILASLTDNGRAGIVCPQGVLFRGQPEVEEDTGGSHGNGHPRLKRHKGGAEYQIRKALLDARVIDAVISLPLNVFYGAGIYSCLLILRKERPAPRQDHVLFIDAARHYRQLPARNELRPQDVMRMLVHYHAYGDATKVSGLVAEHSGRIHKQIDAHERDERTVGARRRAEDDRQDVAAVAGELIGLYADPDELLRHARVVALGEIEANDFNLSVPRYIDTFEPEPRVEVEDALQALGEAEESASKATSELTSLLRKIGYGSSDTH